MGRDHCNLVSADLPGGGSSPVGEEGGAAPEGTRLRRTQGEGPLAPASFLTPAEWNTPPSTHGVFNAGCEGSHSWAAFPVSHLRHQSSLIDGFQSTTQLNDKCHLIIDTTVTFFMAVLQVPSPSELTCGRCVPIPALDAVVSSPQCAGS